MRIPDIRAQLHVIAADIEAAGMPDKAQQIRRLADETRRRPPIKKAPAQARKMTDRIANHIRAAAAEHPDWSNRKIGLFCGVDGGRVSEVLAGYRT